MALSSLLLTAPAASAPQQGEGEQEEDAETPVPVAPEVLVTATGFDDDPLMLPWSSSSRGAAWLTHRGRTLPESLEGEPSVMVQKTAYGQSSPFIRGFTGFQTVLLVDGVRLNFAGMRAGPNQYWSTVDPYSVERLELVRGPSSVLYGSDAIGGTVNAVARPAPRGARGSGFHAGGSLLTRIAAGGEESATGRAEFTMHDGDDWGLRAGFTGTDYDDLESGGGELPETGYEQMAGDVRFEKRVADGVEWIVAAQTMRQEDVPRTHKTVFAVPFAGTSAGSELQRDHDQTRDLVYSRLQWRDQGGWGDQGSVTVSLHRHDEVRDRLRPSTGSGIRRDLSGFELNDFGVLARFEGEPTTTGTWAWGVEAHHQWADTFRDNFTGGAFTGSEIQGPFGDDSTYDSAALYVQNTVDVSEDVAVIPGLRASWFALDADRVANPDSGGPAVIQVDDDWTALTGSLRGTWEVARESVVFGGLSQGFRAPNLSDLTALDSTSVVETPSPNLDAESYLQAELGWKGRRDRWQWQGSVYRTWISDMIVRSPTGNTIGGTPEVQKSNVGDGWIHGVEVDARFAVTDAVSVYGAGFWMDGEVDQVRLPAGTVVREPLSRLAPLQATAGVRWEPESEAGWWLDAWVWAADDQDQLSLRDQVDDQRIPPGGTPGYGIIGVSGGRDLGSGTRFALTLENLTDKDYRVHGSGVNGPGLTVITTIETTF